MKVEDALRGVARLALDTAPLIYFAERNPRYFGVVEPIFDAIDAGSPTAVTSPIALAECLVLPYRLGLTALQHAFTDLIVFGHNTVFMGIDQRSAERAADLRARYNLTLPDAIQREGPCRARS